VLINLLSPSTAEYTAGAKANWIGLSRSESSRELLGVKVPRYFRSSELLENHLIENTVFRGAKNPDTVHPRLTHPKILNKTGKERTDKKSKFILKSKHKVK